ncbi:MAG: DUF1538 family protein [Rhodobacter sp.]|nr:DUF1538 family protein [Rhodobacter sp.]MCA3558957.1 DUF1538 family protein [Rhodobacter sp.]MCA3702041.1 DUF1538 family protein [Methylobacterium sp.]
MGADLGQQALRTLIDLAPILAVLGLFSWRFLARDQGLLRRAVQGVAILAVGMTLFRFGLEGTLVPLAGEVARGLAERLVDGMTAPRVLAVVGFAVALGGAAALIEPTMAATAERVSEMTGGTIRPMVLRLAVAAGFGFGLGLAGLRLVYGLPLGLVLAPMVAAVGLMAMVAPRQMVPLALDSGAIATSVVTVPMIAAYGVAVAETLPGRSVLADGFGLIVLAMIGSALAVLATATLDAHLRNRAAATSEKEGEP